ncbi:MAG: helix-turn-helix transcriptional regulator [Acidobacteriota bacterium]|nr:helix-turn-helix transcriptional regulator [Acidobacteriota bacterium]
MNTLKNEKIEEMKDRESRQFFYEEHIETGLPIQIRELRKKRKLTQKALAKLAECDQSNISDWENPNYEYTPQISTLKRLANVFDVPLIVRFGSWEELITWDSNLSPENIAPASFDEVVERLEQPIQEKQLGSSQTGQTNIEITDVLGVEPTNRNMYSKSDTPNTQLLLFPIAVNSTKGKSDDVLDAEYLEESESDSYVNAVLAQHLKEKKVVEKGRLYA